jgi:hypothetical protein
MHHGTDKHDFLTILGGGCDDGASDVSTLDINLVMLAARCDLLRLSKRQDTGVLW